MKHLTIAAVFLLAAVASAQETVTLTSRELGLAFEHPADWKVEKTKNNDLVITMPLEGRAEPATLEIYHAMFDDTPEHWELVQETVNKQLRRQVVRQWREQILGVPMLLARLSYDDKGARKEVLTGLVYSASPKKLLFRLTSSADAYEDAEYQFRQVMQSLRTLSGELPQPEDPDRPREVSENPSSVGGTRPPKVLITNEGEKTLVKGEVTHPVKAGGKDLLLHVPAGWAVEEEEDGTLSLTHEHVPGEVKVSVASTLDSPRPDVALLRASAAQLEQFNLVNLREESKPKPNKAGAITVTVWRSGTSEAGERMTFEAYGLLNENYWLATYAHAGALDAKAEAALQALAAGSSVEIVQ